MKINLKMIYKFIINHTLSMLFILFLFLLFNLMYIKYEISKITNSINKINRNIENEIMLQQELKIKLQNKLSIYSLKYISNKYLPDHSYTSSNRIVIDHHEKE